MMVLTGFLLAYLAFFLLTCRAKDSGDEWGPQWLSRGLEVAMRYAAPRVPCSQSLVYTLLDIAAAHRTLVSRPARPSASYALLSTRQLAYSFNQPLSFDTSSVTNTVSMFGVR